MDFTDILSGAAAALSSTNTALDVVKKARNLLTGDKKPSGGENTLQLQLAMDDLATRLITARDAITLLSDDNRKLKDENMRLKKFEIEREQYELRSIAPHAFAYAAKTSVPGEENTPYFCAACFDQAEKSILQFQKRDFNHDTLRCPRCSGQVFCRNDNRPTVYSVPRSRSKFDFD